MKNLIFLLATTAFISAGCSHAQPIRSKNILIVYLSRTNNTKAVAEIIHDNVGGKLVALELEKPYPEDYKTIVQQVVEENESGYLPPLKTKIDSMEKYDVVFIGFPTWGMKLPPPIKSFLKQYDLKGKIVIPFNTNAGYGVGSSFDTMKELAAGSTVLEGFTVEGGIERDGILLAIKDERRKEVAEQVKKWLQKIEVNTNLTAKQQHIIKIAAFTATGDLVSLQKALSDGLDAGLTINQIKEVLVHLYAYCGFPRSIRGLQTFMTVLDQRKAKGIVDVKGAEAAAITSQRSKYERGKEILGNLTGVSQDAPPAGYSAFAPVIDTFLKEHLFADIFERNVLTYAERELVTVSVLSSIGGAEPMLNSHLKICLNVGLTADQLQQFVSIIKTTIGKKEGDAAQKILDDVLKK